MTPRLAFANQLRGVAVLSVMASHLIGVFWLAQDFLQLATLAPAQGGPLPGIVTAITFEWFQPGPFGVGLFFLISGLVVPISLEKHSAARFLAARALRIYPTYVLALGIQLMALTAASHAWRRPMPYDLWTMVSNALLVNALVGRPSIDLVNWTLTIELQFYALVALLAVWIRAGRLAAILVPSLALCGLAFLISQEWLGLPRSPSFLHSISVELPFLCIILTGVLFNYHVRERLSTPGLLAGIAAMAGTVALTWWFSVIRDQFTHVAVNYLYALILFAACYGMRRRMPVSRLLDSLAAISYPLYLTHALIGYLVMKSLMLLAGFDYYSALVSAVVGSCTAAAILHAVIEKPSMAWGRQLSSASKKRLPGRISGVLRR